MEKTMAVLFTVLALTLLAACGGEEDPMPGPTNPGDEGGGPVITPNPNLPACENDFHLISDGRCQLGTDENDTPICVCILKGSPGSVEPEARVWTNYHFANKYTDGLIPEPSALSETTSNADGSFELTTVFPRTCPVTAKIPESYYRITLNVSKSTCATSQNFSAFYEIY